jgi:iron-sulfur cluster assembly protein
LAHTDWRLEDVIMAAPRPKPQVMRLTEAAAERIKAVMAKADSPIAAVRVGVKNGGCAGMSYYMEYAKKADLLDEVIEDKGVRILIDPKAVLFLLGTEMDYKVENCRRSSSSTIRIRPRRAAAANRSSSSRRAKRRSAGNLTMMATPSGQSARWPTKRSARQAQ